jgi:hypothetical protein
MHRIGIASGLAAMTSMGLPPRPETSRRAAAAEGAVGEGEVEERGGETGEGEGHAGEAGVAASWRPDTGWGVWLWPGFAYVPAPRSSGGALLLRPARWQRPPLF